jgi:hypothetical protein
VTPSLAKGTICLLFFNCYQLPMHGHQIVHLLDDENDIHKVMVDAFHFFFVVYMVTGFLDVNR